MANYKRKKPKNARAGCLMCKPWKANGQNKFKNKSQLVEDERRKENA